MLSEAKSAFGGRKIKGFTLIELLIVVVILGILAVTIFLIVGNSINRAKDANAKNAVEAVRNSMEQYRALNEGGNLDGICGSSATSCEANTSFRTTVANSGATPLSGEPKGADGALVRLSFTTGSTNVVYRIEDKAVNGYCWYKDSSGNTNFSSTPSAGSCTLF